MKKGVKKIVGVAVALGVLMGGGMTTQASTTSDSCANPYVCVENGVTLRTNANTYSTGNVKVSVKSSSKLYNWTMKIQKKTSSGWTTYSNAGSYSGYTDPSSPSSRTFYISKFSNGTYRVYLDIVGLDSKGDQVTNFSVKK